MYTIEDIKKCIEQKFIHCDKSPLITDECNISIIEQTMYLLSTAKTYIIEDVNDIIATIENNYKSLEINLEKLCKLIFLDLYRIDLLHCEIYCLEFELFGFCLYSTFIFKNNLEYSDLLDNLIERNRKHIEINRKLILQFTLQKNGFINYINSRKKIQELQYAKENIEPENKPLKKQKIPMIKNTEKIRKSKRIKK